MMHRELVGKVYSYILRESKHVKIFQISGNRFYVFFKCYQIFPRKLQQQPINPFYGTNRTSKLFVTAYGHVPFGLFGDCTKIKRALTVAFLPCEALNYFYSRQIRVQAQT